MDKENKPQPDSLSVSTISNGGYSYEAPPPAYSNKKSTTIALARIAATTILVAAFILGAFIVAGSYVSALTKCNCPQEHHQLPQTASLVGINTEEKQDVLTKPESAPAKIIEKQPVEEEVKVPITVTTTTETPDIEDEESPLETLETSEKIMNLLQRMLEIDPSMKGNMRCKVSKQPHPLDPEGKPLLQVHCKKATTMQIIRPIGNPLGPLNPISGPRIFRIPSPISSPNIFRMPKPVLLPIRRILPSNEPSMPFLEKPNRNLSKLPFLMKLSQLPNAFNGIRPLPTEPRGQPENFPIFPPQKKPFLDGPPPRPKLRFIVPLKNENEEEPPFRQDFPQRDPPPRFPEDDYSDDDESQYPDESQEDPRPPQFPQSIFRPFSPRFPPLNFRPNSFSQLEPESQPDIKMPEKHLMPPTDLQDRRPDFFPEPLNDDKDDDEEPEPSFRPKPIPFSSPPEYNDEKSQEQEPEGPIAIPLKRTEPGQQGPFPFSNPLSLLQRIRQLQNIPPHPVVPRT